MIAKRSGKVILALRMIVIAFALILMQLVFSPYMIWPILLRLLERIAVGIRLVWFIPPFWPSLVIDSVIVNDFAAASAFALLTAAFVFFILLFAAQLRHMYWVPVPVATRLSNAVYSPRVGILNWFGFNETEASIIRKDLRSLTRRREMARFLAIPFVMVIPMIFQATIPGPGQESILFSALSWALPTIVGLSIFALVFSMISIGQEGSGVWNIYVTPVSPRELLRAKLGTGLVICLPLLFVFWMGANLLGNLSAMTSLALLIATLELIIVSSLIGFATGVTAPDFTESVRARFVDAWAMIVGMIFWVIAGGLVLAPYAAALFLGLWTRGAGVYFPVAILISLIIAVVIWLLAYRVSISGARRLLKELPT